MSATVQPTRVRARTTPAPGSSWKPGRVDRKVFPMVIRGTWVFRHELDVERLTTGLAGLLEHYPHLAGRVVGDERVALDNTGVPFSVVRRDDLTVAALVADHALAERLVRKPRWKQIRRGKAAPMTVTITRLGDGDVLTLDCWHALMDGHSFYTMARDWARLVKGLPVEPPVVDQSLLAGDIRRSKDEAVQEARALGWKKFSLLGLVRALPYLLSGKSRERTRPIHLSDAGLERLAATAARESGRDDLSRTDVLTAHIARMCSMLQDLPEGTPFAQAIVVDSRQRIASVPANFVGNAALVIGGTEFRVGESLGEVAARTHRRIGPYLSKPSKSLTREFRLGNELIHHKALWGPYDFSAHTKRPRVAYINSFVKFPIYDVDFGDSESITPVRVIPHNLSDPILIWPAPPDAGGLEIYLTGALARAAKGRPPQDDWWRQMRGDR